MPFSNAQTARLRRPPLPDGIYTGEPMNMIKVRAQPLETLPQFLDFLDYRRQRRLTSLHPELIPRNLEAEAMEMVAILLDEHHQELNPATGARAELYERAIAALICSVNEIKKEYDFSFRGTLNRLSDPRLQKVLREAREERLAEQPRELARWAVFKKLQAANGGSDPAEFPPDYEQQVDAELARMIAEGEVAAPQRAGSEIPAPPRPEGWQEAIDPLTASAAKQAVGGVFSLRRWSAWQVGALAAILAAAGWAGWRRFAK